MSRYKYDVSVQLGVTSNPNDRSGNLRRWWSVIITLLAIDVFTESVFAGALLSGVGWAQKAHSINAAVLIAATIAAGLVAIATRRRVPHGIKLGLTLLSLAVVILLQAALGAMSAKGANLLWAHIPLGVALFGLALHAAAGAWKLRAE